MVWNRARGGFFLWVRLPEELDAAEMLPHARRNGVTYVPGAAFVDPTIVSFLVQPSTEGRDRPGSPAPRSHVEQQLERARKAHKRALRRRIAQIFRRRQEIAGSRMEVLAYHAAH